MTSSAISIKRVRPLLGTFVEIELRGRVSERFLQGCITRGFSSIEQIDQLMSVHRLSSDINRLNHSRAGRWIRLHPLTIKVLSASNTLHQQTGGLFDIRCKAAHRSNTAPLKIRGRCARKSGPWVFDLGGIAKGFAVDQATERIQHLTSKRGVSGIVNAGGDLRIWGNQAAPLAVRIEGSNRYWIKPGKATALAMATSSVRRTPTSGVTTVTYRNFISGHRLKRPDTATVVAERCLWADALTKVALLGTARETTRCLSSYGARAVIYDGSGRIRKGTIR